ncbi:MAG: hypothetical protein ABI603_07750 [Acidobacteriota bacterium]
MNLPRRFIFRGNAAAIGGRIVRPVDCIIDSSAASSLTVAGGLSRARAGATTFCDGVSIGGAETSAEGLFDDLQQHVALTYRRGAPESVTTSTRVSSDVTKLTVGDTPQMTIDHVRASLAARSPAGSGEPGIAVGEDTAIEGLAIGQYRLKVELAVPFFRQHDTRSKLLAAADDPRLANDSVLSLLMKATLGGAPSPGRLLHCFGTTYATLVKSITWDGAPYPGAEIDHNCVIVPEFGRVFLGELLITDLSRRLTMVRLELGSPSGGDVVCVEVESNGTWSS